MQKGVPYWDMVEGNLHFDEVVVEVLCGTVAETQILLCMKVEDIVAIETEDIGVGFVVFVVAWYVPQDS